MRAQLAHRQPHNLLRLGDHLQRHAHGRPPKQAHVEIGHALVAIDFRDEVLAPREWPGIDDEAPIDNGALRRSDEVVRARKLGKQGNCRCVKRNRLARIVHKRAHRLVSKQAQSLGKRRGVLSYSDDISGKKMLFLQLPDAL